MANNQDLVSATGAMLVARLNTLREPGEKMGTAMSVAFNAIVTNAAMLMGDQFNPMEGVFPSMDHILLSSFLINAGCTMNSDASVRTEFSPERLLEALEDFKRFTNRDGIHLLDQNLKRALEAITTVDLSKFGENRKFLQ